MTQPESSLQVVILCGGKGTRSYPFTDHFPKALMPIGGKPIIVHLMEIYARQGHTDFILAAGHRQEILADYFEGRFSNWNVIVHDTGEESDTGERIRRCEPLLRDRFMVTYGDGLGNVHLDGLLKLHEECGGLATVTTVRLRSQYGTVHFSGTKQVTSFREKPVIPDHWINAGFFVFEREAFDHWEGTNLESDVLPALAGHGGLYAYQHEGFWKSMDTSKDQQAMERLVNSAIPPWMENGHGRSIRTEDLEVRAASAG